MSQVKKVFISYDRADTLFAHRLAEDLKGLGVEVWIAPESILPGEGWVDAINRGLNESSHMVTVLTPSALESQWVKKETNVAISMERNGQLSVIPLDVESCNPPPLWTSYQMIPFREDYEKGLRQLVSTLELGTVPEKPLPPPKPSPKPSPESQLEPSPEPQPERLTMSQILERVRELVAEQFGIHISNVRPETNLINDLNKDDLDHVELIMEFEDAFDISFQEDEAEKLHTVRDWAAYIMQCMQG